MARLNETEKLIQRAAKRLNPLEATAYDNFFKFFTRMSLICHDNSTDIILKLYCSKHERLTFDRIAADLHVSLSRLERKRRDFQTIFISCYNELIAQPSVA